MKHLIVFEKFHNSDVEFCIQNLIDIGFDYWESESRLFVADELVIDIELINELEASSNKLNRCGYKLSAVKYNGSMLKPDDDYANVIFFSYPGLNKEKSDKHESIINLCSDFKKVIANEFKLKTSMMCLSIETI